MDRKVIVVDEVGDFSEKVQGAMNSRIEPQPIIAVDDESSKKSLKDSLLALSYTPIKPQPIIPLKSQRDALTALAAMSMWGIPLVKPFQKKEKPLQKCGLKECNVMTIKDFCCAEHYRIAKAKHKS